jgi:hypothetical protein
MKSAVIVLPVTHCSTVYHGTQSRSDKIRIQPFFLNLMIYKRPQSYLTHRRISFTDDSGGRRGPTIFVYVTSCKSCVQKTTDTKFLTVFSFFTLSWFGRSPQACRNRRGISPVEWRRWCSCRHLYTRQRVSGGSVLPHIRYLTLVNINLKNYLFFLTIELFY